MQEEVEGLLQPLLTAQPAELLEWEQHFRQALLAAGQKLFGLSLQQRIDQIDQHFQPKPDQRLIGRRPLEVATLFGTVSVRRDYYIGEQGGHCPADAALGWEGRATPALARLICRAAAQEPYGQASRLGRRPRPAVLRGVGEYFGLLSRL